MHLGERVKWVTHRTRSTAPCHIFKIKKHCFLWVYAHQRRRCSKSCRAIHIVFHKITYLSQMIVNVHKEFFPMMEYCVLCIFQHNVCLSVALIQSIFFIEIHNNIDRIFCFHLVIFLILINTTLLILEWTRCGTKISVQCANALFILSPGSATRTSANCVCTYLNGWGVYTIHARLCNIFLNDRGRLGSIVL